MKKIFAILLTLISVSQLALAREPYHALVTVDTFSETVSAPNLFDLKTDLRTVALEQIIPIYTPTSAVSLDYNLRGLIARTSFAENSTNLVVVIPNADIVANFDGGTRDNSITLFKEFIKEGRSVPKFLKAYARYSPIDPIAGNPNSLLAQMAQADYRLGNLSPLAGCDCSWSAQPIIHQFQAGLNYERAFAKQFETTSVTLPARYSYSPDHLWAFIVDAPLTYNRNGGASSFFGSIVLGCEFLFLIVGHLLPHFESVREVHWIYAHQEVLFQLV